MDILNKYIAGIKKVECALAKNIAIQYYEKLRNNLSVEVEGCFDDLCIVGLGALESKQTSDGGQYLYTTTLKFRAGKEDDEGRDLQTLLSNDGQVYILTTIDGDKYMLGTNEKPYTSMQSNKMNPGASTGTSITEFEVSYINTHGLLKVSSVEHDV